MDSDTLEYEAGRMTRLRALAEAVMKSEAFGDREMLELVSLLEPRGFYRDLSARDAVLIARLVLAVLDGQ